MSFFVCFFATLRSLQFFVHNYICLQHVVLLFSYFAVKYQITNAETSHFG